MRCSVQKAVNVDLVTRAHIDFPVGDDGDGELDRRSRVVAVGVLIAVIKFLRHVIGVDGKETGLGKKQYDSYDIPPVAELRAIWDINLGGQSDWDETEVWTIKYGDNRINIADIDAEF